MEAKKATLRATSYQLDLPDSKSKVSVEMEMVPAESMPESLRSAPNVARVQLGGRDFFAVMGKTAVID